METKTYDKRPEGISLINVETLEKQSKRPDVIWADFEVTEDARDDQSGIHVEFLGYDEDSPNEAFMVASFPNWTIEECSVNDVGVGVVRTDLEKPCRPWYLKATFDLPIDDKLFDGFDIDVYHPTLAGTPYKFMFRKTDKFEL